MIVRREHLQKTEIRMRTCMSEKQQGNPPAVTSERGRAAATLPLVYRLCNALDTEEVVYCHWKSNEAIDRSLSGENDLDLLVRRGDIARFTEILCRLGFVETRGPAVTEIPGIANYYGYDATADKIVHVHAHYQLVVGHDLTKNYHLPIERPYLESAVRDGLFRIPAADFELVVFVIRMMLKHAAPDTFFAGYGALSAREQRELDYLQDRADRLKVYDILKQHLPCVDASLFDKCLRSLRGDCRAWTRIGAGRQLQRRLSAHARRPYLTDVCLKPWRRLGKAIRRRVFGRLPAVRLARGGAVIAVVGGDGAGKSTAIKELHSWLSKEFQAVSVHLGKPAWSWTTVAVRGVLKLGRLLGLWGFRKTPVRYTVNGDDTVFPGYPALLRAVCTAHDRYRAYAKARRTAANGGLVICDRYPLAQIKLMDDLDPDLVFNNEPKTRLVAFLVRLGQHYHRRIMPPEILIVLRVDPSLAVLRKTDEEADSVRARCQEVWEADWRHIPAQVIDASRPKAEVLSELKSHIWSRL